MEYVSGVISKLGKKAGVKVDDRKGKFASAQDLRRSFGSRWATRVMPAVLMQLMRHESIETTMSYYVGQDAVRAADAVWEAAVRAEGGVLGGTGQNEGESENENGNAKRVAKEP